MIAINLVISNPLLEWGRFNVIKKFDKKIFNKLDSTFQIYKNTYNLGLFELQISSTVATFQVGLFGYHLFFRTARQP